jgi:hypothetical protein
VAASGGSAAGSPEDPTDRPAIAQRRHAQINQSDRAIAADELAPEPAIWPPESAGSVHDHDAITLGRSPSVPARLPGHISLVGATVAAIVGGLTMARVGGLGLAMRG